MNSLLCFVLGEADSLVSGILLKDGRFEGKLLVQGEEYFIEKSEKYLKDEITKDVFHSVRMLIRDF